MSPRWTTRESCSSSAPSPLIWSSNTRTAEPGHGVRSHCPPFPVRITTCSVNSSSGAFSRSRNRCLTNREALHAALSDGLRCSPPFSGNIQQFVVRTQVRHYFDDEVCTARLATGHGREVVVGRVALCPADLRAHRNMYPDRHEADTSDVDHVIASSLSLVNELFRGTEGVTEAPE